MMKFLSCITVMVLGLTIFAGIASARDDEQGDATDKRKAVIVSRIYQLTYGADAMCKLYSPRESAQVSAAVVRFRNTYPELMQLVEQSPYFDRAKRRFSEMVEIMSESASQNPREAECQASLYTLQQSVDTENGRQGILDTIAELKK